MNTLQSEDQIRINKDIVVLIIYLKKYGSLSRREGMKLWNWTKYRWQDRVNRLLVVHNTEFIKNDHTHRIENIDQKPVSKLRFCGI